MPPTYFLLPVFFINKNRTPSFHDQLNMRGPILRLCFKQKNSYHTKLKNGKHLNPHHNKGLEWNKPRKISFFPLAYHRKLNFTISTNKKLQFPYLRFAGLHGNQNFLLRCRVKAHTYLEMPAVIVVWRCWQLWPHSGCPLYAHSP